MKDFFQDMVQLLSQGESFVLVTLFSRSGSAPRTAGARMIVREDGSILGTIGGGLLEARVQEMAPEVFRDKKPLVQEFILTGKGASRVDMICGGRVELLLEFVDAANGDYLNIYSEVVKSMEAGRRSWLLATIPDGEEGTPRLNRCLFKDDGTTVGSPELSAMVGVGSGRSPIGLFGEGEEDPNDTADITTSRYPVLITIGQQRLLVEPMCSYGTVYVFGAGHISQKLVPLSNLVGFRTVVVDDRQEFANRERFDTADQIVLIDSFDRALEGLYIDRDSYLVIVTRGHVHDKTVLSQALKTDACYVGMIGSKKKRNVTYRLLSREGFTEQDFSRVHSPIGLEIGAESPEEIAVCIVAELIKVRAGKD